LTLSLEPVSEAENEVDHGLVCPSVVQAREPETPVVVGVGVGDAELPVGVGVGLLVVVGVDVGVGLDVVGVGVAVVGVGVGVAVAVGVPVPPPMVTVSAMGVVTGVFNGFVVLVPVDWLLQATSRANRVAVKTMLCTFTVKGPDAVIGAVAVSVAPALLPPAGTSPRSTVLLVTICVAPPCVTSNTALTT
jgi:hypothetical protein